MEDFVVKFNEINEPKTLIFLCGLFIFTDILTGYLKALKFKQLNSSISRDGYVKKISWIVAILLGFAIDYLVNENIFLIGSAAVCIGTESISVYENLSEVGVKLPFKSYFEKLDGGNQNE